MIQGQLVDLAIPKFKLSGQTVSWKPTLNLTQGPLWIA
jgi:hypothetical protein